MERLVSVARRPSVDARCAFCHDTLGDEWDVCSGCNTRLHPECRAQIVECPTLGCRMSVMRLRWAQPRLRPRPAFRRALARMAERHASGRVPTIEEPEADPVATWPAALFLVHAIISPFALLALSLFFLAFYVPAWWASRLSRSWELANAVRDQARGIGQVFTFEAAFVPFVVVAMLAGAVVFLGLGAGTSALVFGNLTVGSLVFLPPAFGWLGR
jgi:hypothetical protein